MPDLGQETPALKDNAGCQPISLSPKVLGFLILLSSKIKVSPNFLVETTTSSIKANATSSPVHGMSMF